MATNTNTAKLRRKIIIWLSILLTIAAGYWTLMAWTYVEPVTLKPHPPGHVKSDEERQLQTQIDVQFSSWDGSHRKLNQAIKQQLYKPDSFKHISTEFWEQPDHLLVVTQFKANTQMEHTKKQVVKAKIDKSSGEVIEIYEWL